MKKITQLCELDESKECNNCLECEKCDLDENKVCDNCCECLKIEDVASIKIDEIII